MDNVNSRIKLTTQTNHQLDRVILRRTRARVKKTPVVAISSISSYRSRQFSMNNQHRTEARKHRHRLAQVLLSYMRKLIDTGRHKKTLEPNHTCFKHPRELRRITRNDTAPKSNINKTITARRGQFSFEVDKCGRRRNRIQWHVDERRDTACGRGSRRTAKAFPLSSSGCIDMHMCIDKSWHHH